MGVPQPRSGVCTSNGGSYRNLGAGLANGQMMECNTWPRMAEYFLVMEVPGPAWDHSRPRREQDGWDEHATFIDGLAKQGVIVLGGSSRRSRLRAGIAHLRGRERERGADVPLRGPVVDHDPAGRERPALVDLDRFARQIAPERERRPYGRCPDARGGSRCCGATTSARRPS